MSKILIVEDEEALSDPLAFLLGREGFQTIVVDNGLDALPVFDREGADLVREGGLGQEDALGGKGYAAGFFECQQGFEMAQFDDGIHWFSRFQTTF